MSESEAKPSKVAVVGSGISGMVAAYLLQRDHDVTVFEANDYVGGHTHTIDVELEGQHHAVDTGFIVFCEPAYPNFTRLMAELGVESQPTYMSFSVQCDATGLEYNGTSLNTLFAQRRNLIRPSFYRMLRDIVRFYRESVELLEDEGPPVTLGEYLERNTYSQPFVDQHILPLGSAIWSTSVEGMLDFPAHYFVRFFERHGFLRLSNRPPWRVIKGGSHTYVKALTRAFADRIRVSSPVASVAREADSVSLTLADGTAARFDAIVIAAHSDEALKMLADPSPSEREILGAIPYQDNEVILHTDDRILPQTRRAWASWNYRLPAENAGLATLTYNMNMLQSLSAPQTFCVTVNDDGRIDPGRILRRFSYAHPRYTLETLAAQGRHGQINGVNRTYFCGAYWGYGFHEDGVNSALAALKPLGIAL